MIVTDPDGEDVYVVMGLDRYEDLRNETGFDDEMAEDEWNRFEEEQKRLGDWDANSDIITKHEESEESITENTPDIWGTMKPAGDEGETWDLAQLSEEEAVNLEEQYKKYTQELVMGSVPEAVLETKSEEIPPKLAENEEDFGEEQFYLEPIE